MRQRNGHYYKRSITRLRKTGHEVRFGIGNAAWIALETDRACVLRIWVIV